MKSRKKRLKKAKRRLLGLEQELLLCKQVSIARATFEMKVQDLILRKASAGDRICDDVWEYIDGVRELFD